MGDPRFGIVAGYRPANRAAGGKYVVSLLEPSGPAARTDDRG